MESDLIAGTAVRTTDTSATLATGNDVDLSVIVPVIERPEPLLPLYEEYAAPLRAAGYRVEFLFVSHPYFDHVLAPVRALAASDPTVRVIQTPTAVGETTLLRVGQSESRGRMILTLPAYHQVDAAAIPTLVARLQAGADLVVAHRWPRRHDSLINRLQNRALHVMIGQLGGKRMHDAACGVRVMRREFLEEIPLYGDFARFLPLLALYNGYRVEELASTQHPLNRRARVYGPGVYVRRLMDVLGLFFLLRFTDKPLRFFGLVGASLSGVGALLLVLLFFERVTGSPISQRPLLLLGVLFLTLGMQAIALGLIGEIVVHFNASRRPGYRLRPADREGD